LRRERRIEVTKPVDPKTTTPGNCEPGIDRDLVSDGEKLGTQPVIGPLDILERYLLSLPEEKNSRMPGGYVHNNAKRIGYLPLKPNETDLFCGLPVKCSLVSPTTIAKLL
jgi:hypothetical protein